MQRINNIYCVIKLSEYDYHQSSKNRRDTFNRLSSQKREQIHESHENQLQFIQNLKKISTRLAINITFLGERETKTIQPLPDDVVISCGGDGTFLSCAQNYQKSILFGMNSDYMPKAGLGSIGALTSTNRLNLEDHLNDLKEGRFFVDQWNRLQVKINGQIIDRYAVNDIYFGQKISYQTCDVTIQQSGLTQEFNCSGVLCCTGMGSHAWYYNAGGSPFSNELDAFGFLVFFPNLKRPLEFTSGVISSRNELIMISEGEDYILSFDSKSDVIGLELGDEIRISLAQNKAIRVVSFYE